MTGDRQLDNLLASLDPKLDPNVYVFATMPNSYDAAALSPRLQFEEAEGTTLIVTRDVAEKQGIAYEFPCRLITLNVHSPLESVGFIAAIAARLASAAISANPVAGFFHDHVFVPEDSAAVALAALEELAAEKILKTGTGRHP